MIIKPFIIRCNLKQDVLSQKVLINSTLRQSACLFLVQFTTKNSAINCKLWSDCQQAVKWVRIKDIKAWRRIQWVRQALSILKQGVEKQVPRVKAYTPFKKPKAQELTDQQKEFNRALASIRIRIVQDMAEHHESTAAIDVNHVIFHIAASQT